MYEEYFKLSDAPFRLNPDPRFFYGSRSHNKAMAYLHYGLKQAEGFIVITGPVGAGKSMVIGHLLDQLNSSNVVAANLLTSNVEPNELLSQILSAFRIEAEGEGRTGEIEAFEDYLFDQLNRGRRVLLIIDEAQNLPFKTLEELRMLSNLDYEGTPLFQVFLVGQPEFRTIIESSEMEQLRQRVIASYHLESLSEEETRDYILHRLSVAGWQEDPVFADGAFKIIFEETTGLPRRINTLCNRLMLYCSLEKKHEITPKIVETVCAELREEKLEARKQAAAMPPVSKVESEETMKEEAKPATKEEKPVEAKKKETPKPNTTETVEVDKPADDAPIAPSLPTASTSVFDRLRAKKDNADASTDRQEATLNDVASAIAAASNGATDTQVPAEEAEAIKAAGDKDTPQWRKALATSIDETREELKAANTNIMKLTRSVVTLDERRKDRRRKIVESLTRAEELLSALNETRN
ncbi:XrtA/PEP-CTERM system-associated ATPase [Hyphococcus sp. DH-69]|uniref:XrtA/PEP-CTERM system-associated ATPase n=1 Tax=Hyphococcus formosus TaxID=3143534 RepID=UPI00398A7AF6